MSLKKIEVVDIFCTESRILFVSGKLITSIVTGIAHRRPQGESYDQAIRNDATGLWQCPFCQQDNFPELSEVTNTVIFPGCLLHGRTNPCIILFSASVPGVESL